MNVYSLFRYADGHGHNCHNKREAHAAITQVWSPQISRVTIAERLNELTPRSPHGQVVYVS